jgi:hypothetical protein
MLGGCAASDEVEAPVFVTPEQALDYYIESLRAGNLAGIVKVTYPPATDFYLPGRVDVLDYKVIDKRMLTESEAAEYRSFPEVQQYYDKRAGDVGFDIRRIQSDGIENMFTYWFRKIGASWKLYAWSGWGTDDFCYEC